MTENRVDVLGSVTVTGPAGRLQGLDLGGRRARVALVALALHRRPMSAQRLAELVWNGEPPATWPAALRNVIRDLRMALAAIGLGEQQLITTEPNGYGLTAVQTDLAVAEHAVEAAEKALADHPADALRLAEPASLEHGDDLLSAEDAPWLAPHRTAVEVMRARAFMVIAGAAAELGDHERAVAAARLLVDENPIDERCYRALIVALDKAGDRSGVVQAYERCRTMLADQLGVDPSAETVEVYLAALRSDPSPAGARLPPTTNGFFARDAELAELIAAMEVPGAVTLVGRGGVGKTRLALEAATRFRGRAEVRWIGLVGVPADELVAPQVALALGVDAGSTDPVGTLAEQLAPLGRCILVLDGCEELVDGVSSLVSGLLPLCPEATVVTTSRRPLAIDDERGLEVLPLPADTTNPNGAAGDASAELLRARVAERGRPLPDDSTSRGLIDELCRRCAGLPLALELVAAQLVDTSLADLTDELRLPAEGGLDELTAVLDRSYQLLDEHEARVFRRCAVLAGPVSLPLLRAVAADESLPPLRVTRIVRALTGLGLLTADRTGARWRYQQDDDLRWYARQQLSVAEEGAALGRLGVALTAMLPDDPKASPMPFAAALTEVAGSVRAFLEACTDGRAPRESGLQMAFRLHRYWAARSITEGGYWLGRLLAGAEPGRWTALATFAHGYLLYWAGQSEALALLQSAAERLQGVDESFRARALMYLAGQLDDQGRGAEALVGIRESARIAEEIGDDNLYVGATIGVGSILAERGDPAAAEYALAALARGRATSPIEQLAGAMPTAAQICWQVGDLATARALIEECRPHLIGDARIARVYLLSVSAGLALSDRDLPAAIELAGQADSEGTELGVDRELPMIRSLLAWALALSGDSAGARERAAAAVDAGAGLDYDGPLATALEVAALVAEHSGSTDPAAIAMVLGAAQDIRIAGDRPAFATFRPLVDEIRSRIGTATAAGRADVLAAARLMLGQ